MPAYEYELIDTTTGEAVGAFTLLLPVAARDRIVLRRHSIPRRVTVLGHARNERREKTSALAGYHRLEQKLGSRFKSRFSAEQIKAAHAAQPGE